MRIIDCRWQQKVMPSMREWYRAHIMEPRERAIFEKNVRQAARAESKVRTPATAEELAAIAAISPGEITYVPGIGTKRFAGQIQGETELTDRQRHYLWSIVWKFRRQIRNPTLVELAKEFLAD